MILDLINHIALLVMLAVGLGFLSYRLLPFRPAYLVVAGLLFGLTGVIGMMAPLHFAPGVIYDGRSIVISLAAVFGGPVVVGIAALICTAFRIYIGGIGTFVGVLVIVVTALLGVGVYYLRGRDRRWVEPMRLWLFSVVVHILMLLFQLLIPNFGPAIVTWIGPSVLVLFPLAFLLISLVFIEVEKRREAEVRLLDSEAYYRSLFENEHVPMLIVDPATTGIYDANEAAARFYGWSREILRSMSITAINTMPSVDVNAKMAFAMSRRLNHFSFKHRMADNTVRDVDVVSGPIRFGNRDYLYSLVHDVTERNQAQIQLRENERYLRAMIDASPLGIIGMTADGIVLTWNRAAEQIFGWAAHDVMHLFPPFLIGREREIFGELLSSVVQGETIAGHELKAVEKKGEPVDVCLSLAPIADEHGAVTSILGIVEDVTRRKKVERDHEIIERQLFQARKMEAIGQLAGGIAHDFNNLLQVIIGHGEIMTQRLAAAGRTADDLVHMLSAAERAAKLVRQMLAFSRRQVLDMKDVDLNEVLEDCLKLLRRLIGEHITLEMVKGHRLATVQADIGQLEQIVMNLCVNARDAMPEGGIITLETENVLIDDSYLEQHPYAHPGRYVLLSVTDTGIGMSEETSNRVFEPFFTTKSIGNGTGLGLATVYGLVKQHEGIINVYSEIGRGTTFKIYLPAVERSASSIGDKILGAIVGGSETILVAEDDAAVLNLTTAILERAGYRVFGARDGEMALEVFRQHAGTINLSIIDVVMPKLGGFQVFKQIRDIDPKSRVLFTSGYSVNAIHADFVLHEGLQLIQKPCSREDLLRQVRAVLDAPSK